MFGAALAAGPIPSIRAEVAGDRVVVERRRRGRPRGRRARDGLDGALARWADGFAAAAGVGAAAAAADRLVLLVPLLRAGHPGRHRGEPARHRASSTSPSTSSRSTTATRPRSATGSRCRTGSPRWRTSSAGSGAPAAGPASGSRRSWWASGPRSPASTRTGWSAARRPGTRLGASSWPRSTSPIPGAEAYLREVFGTLRDLGIDYFKIDFIYAGAMEGRRPSRGRGRGRLPARACGSSARRSARSLPARLRRADPAQRRAGRRHAGRPRHRATTSSRVDGDLSPALPARGRAEQPVAGLAARPVLGQRRRLPGRRRRTWSGARSGPRWSSATAGCAQQRPAARPGRLGAGDHPPAAPAGADRPVRALTARSPTRPPCTSCSARPRRRLPACSTCRGTEPLEDWEDDRLTEIPQRGISRHVVRFVAEGGEVFALKEIPERLARREYTLLRQLKELGIPAVDVLGMVVERPDDLDADAGHPLPRLLVVLPGAVRQPARART